MKLKDIMVYGSGFTSEKKKKFPYPMFREVDLKGFIKDLDKKYQAKWKKTEGKSTEKACELLLKQLKEFQDFANSGGSE